MPKFKSYHFVVHNQGPRDENKKQELLDMIQAQYGTSLEAWLIAQEDYKEPDKAGDTHLQGNLFFSNQIHFNALLKKFEAKYPPIRTDKGMLYRTELEKIKDAGKIRSYMIDKDKQGGDPNPLRDDTIQQQRKAVDFLKSEILRIATENYRDLLQRKNQSIAKFKFENGFIYSPEDAKMLRNYLKN
jgi:hypothetical protein